MKLNQWLDISELPKLTKEFKAEYAVLFAYGGYSYKVKGGNCNVRGHVSSSLSKVRKPSLFMIIKKPTTRRNK